MSDVVQAGSLADTRQVQETLTKLGFDTGQPDGIAGPKTRAGVKAFQAEAGFPQTGVLERYQRQFLADLSQRFDNLPEPRASDAALQLLREMGPDSGEVVAMAASMPTEAGVSAALGAPLPTRVFAAPGRFPPKDYRGYGFLAFENQVAPPDIERHLYICQAFLASMRSSGEAAIPSHDQFVTVWPVTHGDEAAKLNLPVRAEAFADRCRYAISAYDYNRAAEILDTIKRRGEAFETVGPFLYGWVPAERYDQEDVLILSLDLSDVNSYPQALSLFNSWKKEIETDPELLKSGISFSWFKLMVGRWADQNGEAALRLIGGG